MSEQNPPTGRIVLFGATGYTGELAARAMAKRGMRPVLAGRRREAVEALAAELGGLEATRGRRGRPGERPGAGRAGRRPRQHGWAVRPLGRCRARRRDRRRGPLRRLDRRAAVRPQGVRAGGRAGRARRVAAPHRDGLRLATGQPDRRPRAARRGRRRHRRPDRLLHQGRRPRRDERRHARLRRRRPDRAELPLPRRADRHRARRPQGPRRSTSTASEKPGISVGTSEAFSLPRAFPNVRDVEVYLGWFGGASRPMQAFSMVGAGVAKIPGVTSAMNAAAARFVKTSTGGPDAEARAATGSRFVAEALGASGDVLATRPHRGRERLHVHRREPRLGGRARSPPGDHSGAGSRWARSRRSASRRSRPASPSAGSPASARPAPRASAASVSPP